MFDLQYIRFCEVNKEFNIKCHYDTKHTNSSKFMSQTRTVTLNRLKNGFKQQSSVFSAFQRQTTELENNTLAS